MTCSKKAACTAEALLSRLKPDSVIYLASTNSESGFETKSCSRYLSNLNLRRRSLAWIKGLLLVVLTLVSRTDSFIPGPNFYLFKFLTMDLTPDSSVLFCFFGMKFHFHWLYTLVATFSCLSST